MGGEEAFPIAHGQTNLCNSIPAAFDNSAGLRGLLSWSQVNPRLGTKSDPSEDLRVGQGTQAVSLRVNWEGPETGPRWPFRRTCLRLKLVYRKEKVASQGQFWNTRIRPYLMPIDLLGWARASKCPSHLAKSPFI